MIELLEVYVHLLRRRPKREHDGFDNARISNGHMRITYKYLTNRTLHAPIPEYEGYDLDLYVVEDTIVLDRLDFRGQRCLGAFHIAQASLLSPRFHEQIARGYRSCGIILAKMD